jgi:hypothetical protein
MLSSGPSQWHTLVAELYTFARRSIIEVLVTLHTSPGLWVVICTAVCPQSQADLHGERPAFAGTIDCVLANNCLTAKLMLCGAITSSFYQTRSAPVI